MNQRIELLPCPFCGSAPSFKPKHRTISCKACCFNLTEHPRDSLHGEDVGDICKRLIQRWNTRAPAMTAQEPKATLGRSAEVEDALAWLNGNPAYLTNSQISALKSYIAQLEASAAQAEEVKKAAYEAGFKFAEQTRSTVSPQATQPQRPQYPVNGPWVLTNKCELDAIHCGEGVKLDIAEGVLRIEVAAPQATQAGGRLAVDHCCCGQSSTSTVPPEQSYEDVAQTIVTKVQRNDDELSWSQLVELVTPIIASHVQARLAAAQPTWQPISADEVVKLLQKHIEDNYGGKQVRFAEAIHVSTSFVSDIMRGNRAPSGIILNAIGYKSVQGFVPADASQTDSKVGKPPVALRP